MSMISATSKHIEEIKDEITKSIQSGDPFQFKDMSKFNDFEKDLIMSAQRAVEVVVKAKIELDINIDEIYIHESFQERKNNFVFILPIDEKAKENFIHIFSIVRDIKKRSPGMKCMFLENKNLNSELLESDGFAQKIKIISISRARKS